MTKEQYGYDDCRFEKDVDEHFHCSICFNVPKDARMCRNNEHIFCVACIAEHLSGNSETCPECKEYLNINTLRRPRVLNNYLSKLKINCDYASRGCPEFVCVEDLESHVAKCGFAPVLCSNQNCGIVIDKQDKVHHEIVTCKNRKCHDCTRIQEDMAAMKGSLLELHGKVRAVKDEIKKNKDEIKQDQQEVKKEVVEVKKEIKYVKENLSKVNEDVKEFKVMMSHMLDKLSMLEVINKLPSLTMGTLNIEKEDIFIAGETDSAEIFSWAKNCWLEISPMNEGHEGASSFIFNDQLFVVGGEDTTTIETLNLNELPLKWVEFSAELPFKGSNHQTVVHQKRIIHIGGYNSDECEQFNVISEIEFTSPCTMMELCQMPNSRDCFCVEAFEDKILIMGGIDDEDDVLDSVLEFDPANNECNEMPPLPRPLARMATARWRDEVVVLGGYDEDDEVLNDVFMYNYKTGRITFLPSMLEKRYNCCAVVTGNTVVVMCGVNDKCECMNSVECLPIGGSAWTYLPEMNQNRYRAVSEVLPSRRKYV